MYYALTGGFTIGNITSELACDPKRDTHPLSFAEKREILQALDQEFTYLGKGCQSYVFASADGQYVIKFFKYQRFRPQLWIDLLTFIPAIDAYQQRKQIEKREKLNKVFTSWKIAYEQLPSETGVVYVHLNKGNFWNKRITIRDKLGLHHEVDLDQTEYVLQKRATMLCPFIDRMLSNGNISQAEEIMDKLLAMLLLEYGRGYADNDHALMQNTGVLEGYPIHIDIGQFIYNDIVKSPKVHKQELYDKTFHFHKWLRERNQKLADHFKERLIAIIGPDYYYSAPYIHKGDVAKIPHVPHNPP